MENKFLGLISFAVLIEALITYFNEFFVGGNSPWQMIISILLGVTIAVAYNLDLPEYFNLKSKIPYVGMIITGILLSRGSNYVFDLLTSITNIN